MKELVNIIVHGKSKLSIMVWEQSGEVENPILLL
jgi:hypothetical protein